MKGIAPLRTVSGNGASNIIISYRDVFLTPLGMDEEQAAGWLLEGRTRLDRTAAAKDDGFQTIERPPLPACPATPRICFPWPSDSGYASPTGAGRTVLVAIWRLYDLCGRQLAVLAHPE